MNKQTSNFSKKYIALMIVFSHDVRVFLPFINYFYQLEISPLEPK